ncbi:MAG: hypothetical protein R3B81_07120 [bacterium]
MTGRPVGSDPRRSRVVPAAMSLVLLFLALAVAPAHATPRLVARSWGLALGGALERSGGSTRTDVRTQFSWLAPRGDGVLPLRAEVGWTHERMHDTLDLLIGAQWTSPIPTNESVWPYAGIWGGLRPEWVGSFRVTRVPVGPAGGLRVLVSDRGGLFVEARALRLLRDPVKDYWEYGLHFGVEILFPPDR